MLRPQRANQRKFAFSKDANFSISDGKTLLDAILAEIRTLPDSPAAKYLNQEILSKFVSSETDPASVRRDRAIEKWLSVEANNDVTERRLLTWTGPAYLHASGQTISLDRVMNKATDLCHTLLGDTVPVRALFGGFSGGASTSKGRALSQAARKYVGTAHVTAEALGYFSIVMEESPGWYISPDDPLRVEVVKGNVLFVVPKTAEIDRVAAKEPDLNMYMQKGVGDFITRRLKRVFRIDLRDQGVNQRLARVGSLTGALATLDLSSASDSVTCTLVERLFPACWFATLRALRSPITDIDGHAHRNVMLSSMGNGFTFPVESLVFYALAKATCYVLGTRGVVSVYGDDIIVPSEAALAVMEVLRFCGFTPNERKSHWTGPFRESCGGHYYNGNDITPFYIRKPIERLTDVILLANQIRLWSSRQGFAGVLDNSLHRSWAMLAGRVPTKFWGGHDYGSNTQLVSEHKPHSRLVAVEYKKCAGVGGLLSWLDTKDRVPGAPPLVTAEIPIALPKYSVKRVPATYCRANTSLPTWYAPFEDVTPADEMQLALMMEGLALTCPI